MRAEPIAAETVHITGHDGLRLTVDRWPVAGGQPVVLLHGGGQTRHAWGATAASLAGRGYDITSIDLRGHGDSEWSSLSNYGLNAFRDDLRQVLAGIGRPAVLIGASLGGMAALLVAGEGPKDLVKALILVDITHAPSPNGTNKIMAFMNANPEGFASVEAAADAVAAYMPHRARPADPSGLMKNLRQRNDRLYWHWDPAFLGATGRDRNADDGRMDRVAGAVTAPTLLVRGDQSEVVSEADAAALVRLIPHARVVDVRGAGHMVAGDQNTVFGAAVMGFLGEVAPADG